MKRILVILLTGALLTGAWGCRQRQEQRQPYTNQYTVQLLETAGNKADAADNVRLKDMLGVPDMYVANIMGANGKLIVNVNAPLTLPDVDAVPVVRVKGADFPQDLVYQAFQNLCADERMVLLSDSGDMTGIVADGTLQKSPSYEDGIGSAILGQSESLHCISQEAGSDGGRKTFFVTNNTVYEKEVIIGRLRAVKSPSARRRAQASATFRLRLGCRSDEHPAENWSRMLPRFP